MISYAGAGDGSKLLAWEQPVANNSVAFGSANDTLLLRIKRHLNILDSSDFDNQLNDYFATARSIISAYLNFPLDYSSQVFHVGYQSMPEAWYRVPFPLFTHVVMPDGVTAIEDIESDFKFRQIDNLWYFKREGEWTNDLTIYATLAYTDDSNYVTISKIDPIIYALMTVVAEMFRTREAFSANTRPLSNVVKSALNPFVIPSGEPV